MNGLRTRDSIDPACRWKLDALYEDVPAWEAAFAAAQAAAEAFPKHAGKLGASADALLAALRDQSALSLALERLYIYAFLQKSEDNGNPESQGRADRAMQLYVQASSNSAFLVPEVLTIPEETLARYAKEPGFAPFRCAGG